MLKKGNRLTKKKDFEIVFKKGESVKKDFLLFQMVKNNLANSRFGFVVSKKISKKATVRNKIKRRLQSAVERAMPILSSKKSHDVVIITLAGIEKKEFLNIKETVAQVFKSKFR